MTVVAVVSFAVFIGLMAVALTGQLPNLRRTPGRSGSRPPGRLADLVRRAGAAYTPVQVVGASALIGLAAGVVVASVTPVRVLAVVPALLAAATPVVMLRRRARERVRALRQAWPDALAQISGSVRAGRPLSHALVDVSLNGPAALSDPLSGMAARIQTVGLVPALHAVRATVADPVTDRIVEVLELAYTEGGRIVLDVIADLSQAVAAEVAATEEAETLALEGKLNARIVFAMPWLVLAMLTARPGPFQEFYRSSGGTLVIAAGAVISLVGIVVASRLSTTPPEPRVLITREGEGL